MTEHKILPGIDNKVIPRQLPHSERLPFLGSFTITPFLQSSGTSSVIQHLFSNFSKASIIASPPSFISSAVIWSLPAALLFLSFLIAILISSLVMASVLTSSSGCATSTLKLKVLSGIGWFKISLKCSTHLAFCSAHVNNTFPFLSFIGIFALLSVPDNSFAIL